MTIVLRIIVLFLVASLMPAVMANLQKRFAKS